MFLQDIDNLDTELEKFDNDLQVCASKLEIGQLNKRKIHTKVNELEEELEETCLRVETAKESKQKEVNYVEQKISDIGLEIRELGIQKSKIDEKLGEQQNTIDKYKTQLSEAEYQSKRKPLD